MEPSSDAYTLVPFEQLSQHALDGVVDEFINREGTDYGEVEVPYSTKVAQVLGQLKDKNAFIVFDHDSQSVSIMAKDELV